MKKIIAITMVVFAIGAFGGATLQKSVAVPILFGQTDQFPDLIPEIKIPDTVAKNKNVSLSIVPLKDKPANLYSITYQWLVFPSEEIFAWPDNTRMIFNVGERTSYQVTLIAAYLYVDEAGKQYVLKLGKITKDINVGSKPPVPPGPIVPDPIINLTGYAKFAYDSCKNLNANKDDAKKLAGSFRSILSSYSAGGIAKDPKSLGDATAASNRLALGASLDTWKPVLDILATQCNKEHLGRDVNAMIKAWSEIAIGLEAYAK